MKRLVGPIGSFHELSVAIRWTWKPQDGSRTWCRGKTQDAAPVGFWTASKQAESGMVATGRWEVERIRDEYTQLKTKGRPKWRQSDSSETA